MDNAFQYDHYVLKKQFVALTGILRIYNPQNELVLYTHQKMFKLREDIRVYADELKTRELLNIQARQIIDFSAYYDVFDSQYATKVGGLRRKGFRSLVQDQWEVFDPTEQQIGLLKEDSVNRALVRRFLLGNLLPQDYDLTIGSDCVADYRQEFHLFHYVLDIDFQADHDHKLDRRLGLAAAILLAIIEGRQHKEG
jgi:uncharacterized protein YxjI